MMSQASPSYWTESISRARGWEYTGVVTRDPVKREIPAASQPSTVRTAKSTICCNVSPTVLAEKRYGRSRRRPRRRGRKTDRLSSHLQVGSHPTAPELAGVDFPLGMVLASVTS